MRLGETPVPIPNTMVKPYSADGTALATVWESRWMPDQTYSATEDISRGEYFEEARRLPAWALHCSLAATTGISFDYFSSGYLDVSVHRVCLSQVSGTT